MNKNKYFAAQDSKETADNILGKIDSWYNQLSSNNYLEKVRQSWAAYHGAYYNSELAGHEIVFGGEQGEIANIPINHIRNLGQIMLTLVTSTRPALQARSINSDYKSLTQTDLANGLLDYYMREKKMEVYLKRAVEYSISMGSGYIKMEWDATSGEILEYNEITQTPIYEGDVKFSNLSPFDVVFDTTKEDSSSHDWVVCRSYKNKFDIAAKFPEMNEEILSVQTKSDEIKRRINVSAFDETDDIAIFELFHKRTPCLPNGRYMMFIENSTVLMDTPMPYRNLPVFRISPSDILGTSYGYTVLFDLLPIQDAINSSYSNILTNQNAFAIQSILVPREANITLEQLSGGMNLIEYNSVQGGGKPEPINFTQTPPEVYKFIEMLEKSMEVISGISSVTRGQPEASLRSANALAMVQSQTLQFISGLQQSYIYLMEDVGSALITMLQDFAQAPRVAAIVGKSKRTFMKEFSGDDLNSINRVIVDVGNPLSRTTAGKIQIAESLLQMGLIKSPEQYFMILSTGELDVMTEGVEKELTLIRRENEIILDGGEVLALSTDDHPLHIKEHKNILSDPDLRKDPKLVKATLDHIREHIELNKTTDPNLLRILNIQPLQPDMPPGSPAEQMQNTESQTTKPEGNKLPKPPTPFQQNPVTPEDNLSKLV